MSDLRSVPGEVVGEIVREARKRVLDVVAVPPEARVLVDALLDVFGAQVAQLFRERVGAVDGLTARVVD